MHKKQSNPESWISKAWLAKQLNLHPYKVHYYAVKLRLRYFKFGGVRYISKDDLPCLLARLKFQFNLEDKLINNVKNKVKC